MMTKQVDNVNEIVVPDPDALMELVHQVMHLARSRQQALLKDACHELSHMESKVLGYFHRHEGATLSDLAQHSRRDKAQLTRLIKGLRERGLLTSKADPADRRHQHLNLSPAGHTLMVALQEQTKVVNAAALRGLSTVQCLNLCRLLTEVKSNLDMSE